MQGHHPDPSRSEETAQAHGFPDDQIRDPNIYVQDHAPNVQRQAHHIPFPSEIVNASYPVGSQQQPQTYQTGAGAFEFRTEVMQDQFQQYWGSGDATGHPLYSVPGASASLPAGFVHGYQPGQSSTAESVAMPASIPPKVEAQPEPYPPFARGQTIGDAVSVEQHGRTWQDYRHDKYFLPNDAVEQDRLDFAHAGYRIILNGALHFAPIPPNPPRVLDIGTGTGIWAIDFARENPQSKVTGSDLTLIQPDVAAQVPNVTFEREDVEDEWVYNEPFDYIHLRLMFSCFDNHKNVARKIFDNLRPGGWVEYQDSSFDIDSDDNSHRGTALHKWCHLVNAGAAAKGKDFVAARKYKDYLKQAGFVDIVEKKVRFWGNQWPSEPLERKLGANAEINAAEVVGAMSIKLLQEGLGLPAEVVQPIVVQAQ